VQQQNLNQIDVSLILVCFIFLWRTFHQSRFASFLNATFGHLPSPCYFSILFLFGKQFWASLHLVSESGWNWCPWQALVSFRFPTHVHCKFMFLSFSCKVGGFFSVQGCINILDWLKYLLLYFWKLSWTLFFSSFNHGKILELRDMPTCANL